MVDAGGDQAKGVLLGVAVRVLEDAVPHAHGERGDEARRRDHADPLVEGAQPQRLQPAPAGAGDRDARAVHLRAREQVVEGAHAVPDLVAVQGRAGEAGQVPEHGVLAAHEVVTAPALRRVPELAALPLPHRVPAEDDVAAPRELSAQLLIVLEGLAVGRVTAGDEYGRMRARAFGHVEERGDVQPGLALEHDLLDAVSVHRDRAHDAGVQGRALARQPAHDLEQPRPDLRPEREQVRFATDGREAHPARVVLAPGEVELITKQGRDTRAGGLGGQDRERLRAGRPGLRAVRRGRRREHEDHREDVHQTPFRQRGSSSFRSVTSREPSALTGWAHAQRTGRRTPRVSTSARRRTACPSSPAGRTNAA